MRSASAAVMRRPYGLLGLVGALALAACQTTSPVVVADPCPTVASAPAEPEPQAPVLTDAQRLAVDVAIIRALGEPLGAAVIRWTDVEHPAWGRRQAARVEATAAWCAPG